MNKCDVTVNKKMTINTGNYSSVQPSVSITLKDVYIENVEDTYKNLSLITHALLMKEIVVLQMTQQEIQEIGLKKFTKALDLEEVQKDMYEAIKNLSGIPEF